MEEGAEIQTKVIANLFNDIIARNFLALCNDIDIHVQETFQTPKRHDQKRQPDFISELNCQN
jgi:hypothetical protein